MFDLNAIVEHATTVIHAHVSRPIVIAQRERNILVRCRVEKDGQEASSVIIKWIKDPNDTVRGFTDWASLAFLSQPGMPQCMPQFLGGDRELRFFIMEDLGKGQNLESLLMGNDRARLTTGLGELARQMGRLHAATIGKEDRFRQHCKTLPEVSIRARVQEAKRWLESCKVVERWCSELEYVPSPAFTQMCARIANVFAEPGEFLAFTHGDPAPTNNYFCRDTAYLLDFEYGAFRHALYDITGWNILCPLPPDLVKLMSTHFRQELARVCVAAACDATYQYAWAVLCSYRVIALLSWMPMSLLEKNAPWVGEWSGREAVLCAVERWWEATRDVAEFEDMAEVAALLAERLRVRWPEIGKHPLPEWPVFADVIGTH